MKRLREEILLRLDGWGNNEQATKAERKACGHNVLRSQLLIGGETENSENGLRLLKEDGWDGDYVTGLTAAQASRFFNGDPIWPDEKDILRMSLFFHDGFYETLALILKGRWEWFLYQQCREGQKRHEEAVPAITVNNERYLIEFSHRIEELLDCNRLFDLMQQHQRFAEKNGFDRISLINLVHAMVIARLQSTETGGPELKAFARAQAEEKRMLESKETLHAGYEEGKAKWIRLKDAIGRLLLQKEMVKGENVTVKAKWAKEFGKEWMEVLALESRYQELNLFIDIKEINPELSFAKTAELVMDSVKERQDQLAKQQSQLKLQMTIGRRLDERGFHVGNLPLDEMVEHIKNTEQMLRETMTAIYKKTHPDRTEREAFTVRQLNELGEIYRTVNELKETEGPDTYAMLPLLLQMREQVEKIWANIGLFTDDNLFFEGEDADVMPRIEIKLKDLEEEEYRIRNDIYVISTDQEVCAKKKDLQSTCSKAQRHLEIEQTRCQIEKKISVATAEAELLFEGEECKWN